MKSLKIILADDHPLIRSAFAENIAKHTNHTITRIFQNGFELWENLHNIECDVLVLDIDMPGKSGFEILERIKQEKPTQKVLMLSILSEEKFGFKALKLGADGYIQKDADFEQILQAIEQIANGEKYIPKTLPRDLILDYLNKKTMDPFADILPEKEKTIFKQLIYGKSNKEIIDELCISPNEFTNIKTSIFKKFNVTSVAELIEVSQKYGLF